MKNAYIEFVKQHPQQQGESAQDRIRRVAMLWRELKNGGKMIGQRPPNVPDYVGGVSAGSNPYGYNLNF